MPTAKLTENIFRYFFPEIHDEFKRAHRGEKKNYISVEQIPDPNSSLSLEDLEGDEISWSSSIMATPYFSKFYDYIPNREDTAPFFQVSAEDIRNGKNEDVISAPSFVSFAKCERKRF